MKQFHAREYLRFPIASLTLLLFLPSAIHITAAAASAADPVERRFELLRPAEYRHLRDQAPVAYLPWGSHEWHGPHLPLGTDSVKAHDLCCAAAKQTGGVVFPPVYCGFGVMPRPTDCSLDFPKALVEETARHYFTQLHRHGFRVIVVVMGHYFHEHVKAIQSVTRAAEQEANGALKIIAEPDFAWTGDRYPGDHAAANETSYMVHSHPQTVDMSRLPALTKAKGLRAQGVMGQDPRTSASAQRGQQQTELLLSRLAQQVRTALQNR